MKSVSIRIEEEMLNKLSYVADYEGRSINSQILYLIRNSIKEYEAKNSVIDPHKPIEPYDNIKLPRKKH